MNNQLQVTEDGSHTLLSEKYGVTYHSKYGAIQESNHVFIKACLLDQLEENDDYKQFSILEIGFGTGLNAYLTVLETLQLQNNWNVNYTSLETTPISPQEVDQLNYPELLKQKDGSLFKKLHSVEWEGYQQISANFRLKKLKKRLEDFQAEEKFNFIFFDAFAPQSQPELWEPEIFRKMYNCLEDGGVLTTYCAKGQVKRNMKAAGFIIEGIPGPPGKREMTRARRV